eukprot:815825-Karenia_brevis.AAC.1
MSVYAPICCTVFGSARIAMSTKIAQMKSMIFSRLFYNTHVWSKLSKFAACKMNAMMMRVLRRIIGCVRYQRVEIKDLE